MSANGNINRLVGWKAIGHFLRCTERTARRWEEDRALPIHRMPGGSRSLVWADADELTLWLQDLPSDVRVGLQVEPQMEAAADEMAEPLPEPQPSPPPGAELISLEGVSPVSQTPRRTGITAAGLILLVALVGAGLLVWRSPAAVHGIAYDDDAEAREKFKTAQFELSSRTADSLAAAERDFHWLVERYPDRAPAWSGLADVYVLMREFASMPDETAYPLAERAASRALALDPHLADAWLSQGFVLCWWKSDRAGAYRAFETALQLDPTSAKGYHWYGTALSNYGDFDKSLRMLARAHALDPSSHAIVADEGWIQFSAGQQEQGLATLERLVSVDPKFVLWHHYLSQAYLVLGRDEEFLREAMLAAELRGQAGELSMLHLAQQAYGIGGRQAMLDQMTATETEAWQRGAGSAMSIAAYRALANDDAGMMKWLGIAESVHEYDLERLRTDVEFLHVRQDPRIASLVRQLP